MNHKDYTEAVEKKDYPTDPICPIGSKFENAAGVIQNLIEKCSVNSVAIIESKAGSERSNHWHKAGDHFLYCLKGTFYYYERDIDSEEYQMTLVKTGMMVYTPPRKVHLTVFLEDTTLISIGSNPRSHEAHEDDLVREKFFKDFVI
jgi:quercetin dioxygenase-like cupin family protein